MAGLGVAAQVAGGVATAVRHGELQLDAPTRCQVGDDMPGVDDVDTGGLGQVAGVDRPVGLPVQHQGHRPGLVQAEHHALEIERQLDQVFLHTLDPPGVGVHAGHPQRRGGAARQQRQQHLPQHPAQGLCGAAGQRLEAHAQLVCAGGAGPQGRGLWGPLRCAHHRCGAARLAGAVVSRDLHAELHQWHKKKIAPLATGRSAATRGCDQGNSTMSAQAGRVNAHRGRVPTTGLDSAVPRCSTCCWMALEPARHGRPDDAEQLRGSRARAPGQAMPCGDRPGMALTLRHACGHRQLGHVQGVTAGCDGALPFVFACLLSVPGWMP
ncbi:MAG: hypothetical protein RLY71_4310 [Pseudomonadota bacterium]